MERNHTTDDGAATCHANSIDARDGQESTDTDTNTDTIKACPECERSTISPRTPRSHNSHGDGATAWKCRVCGHDFDDPLERGSRAIFARRPWNGLASELADPDVTSVDDLDGADGELRTDGGQRDTGDELHHTELTNLERRVLTVLASHPRTADALASELDAWYRDPPHDTTLGRALAGLADAGMVLKNDRDDADTQWVIDAPGRRAVFAEYAEAFEHVHPTNVLVWSQQSPHAKGDTDRAPERETDGGDRTRPADMPWDLPGGDE